uniref:WD_REPEATS_REGION domain-containing protein n=1 Tax=Macrostomum lignano TaxID=282301 RepID=A0A1I8HVS9_9PLAT
KSTLFSLVLSSLSHQPWNVIHRSGGQSSSGSPIQFGEDLQYWVDRDGSVHKFVQIAAMHTELVAVSSNGALHQWRWSEPEPYYCPGDPPVFHPRAVGLGLDKEKIVSLAAHTTRCSVLTDNGRVATFMDEALAPVASRLEHPAHLFPDFQTDRVVSIYCSSLLTAAKCASGDIYWWGVLPFSSRRKAIEKARKKTSTGRCGSSSGTKTTTGSGSQQQQQQQHDTAANQNDERRDLHPGAFVCMKSAPIFHAGAVGFRVGEGPRPKIGVLLEDAWSLTDSCSDQSGPVLVSPGPFKRKKAPTPMRDAKEKAEREEEEEWFLSDVIFVEDGRSQPVGRVLKVDGNIVAVRFLKDAAAAFAAAAAAAAAGSSSTLSMEELSSVGSIGAIGSASSGAANNPLQDCRLLKRDELSVIKGPGCPRVPDFYQKIPKRVPLVSAATGFGVGGSDVLAVAVENTQLHVLLRQGGRVCQQTHSLQGRLLSAVRLLTPASQFSPPGTSMQLLAGTDKCFLIRDGSATIYPLLRAGKDTAATPFWPDLPPLKSAALQTVVQSSGGVGGGGAASRGAASAMSGNSSSSSNSPTYHLSLLVFACPLVTPHVLRGDVAKLQRLAIEWPDRLAAACLNERIDGGRNVIHLAVSVTAPTSNHAEHSMATHSSANSSSSANSAQAAGMQSQQSSADSAAAGGGGGSWNPIGSSSVSAFITMLVVDL